MSLERPQSYFNREFTQIMQRSFTAGERASLGSEMSGYQRRIGERMAELQAEGLVQTIGIPVKQNDPFTAGAYQELIYALPLPYKKGTDKTKPAKSMLLVMPHEHGYDLAIVSPIQGQVGYTKEWIEKRFDKIFMPADPPSIFTGPWKPPESTERTVKTFVDNKVLFYANYEKVPSNVTYEDILETAVTEARERKNPSGQRAA
jgi:hypothetical protein